MSMASTTVAGTNNKEVVIAIIMFMITLAQFGFLILTPIQDLIVVDAFAPIQIRAFVHRPPLNLFATVGTSTTYTDNSITPKQLLSQEERFSIEELVNERSKARWEGDYTRADEIRNVIDGISFEIPWQAIIHYTNTTFAKRTDDTPMVHSDGVQSFKVVFTDFPRSDGGGSSWDLVANPECTSETAEKGDNVLQLAHAALGMVVSLSDKGMSVNEYDLRLLIARAKDRLSMLERQKVIANFLPGTPGSELHGRKAADAALWFALAGVIDDSSVKLYDKLVNIATEELIRFGSNNSCRSKDILHIVERIAMSGSSGPSVQRLYNVAADFLEEKRNDRSGIISEKDEEDNSSIDYGNIVKSLRDSSFGLHSNRPLLGLWRFSTRQRKQKLFFQNAARHYNSRMDTEKFAHENKPSKIDEQYIWSSIFQDPTRPLVVDVGCGMGVSLLGLASLNAQDDTINSSTQAMSTKWEECNFIGVDLSHLTIRYADGVCSRWGLSSRLKFIVDSAEECISKIRRSYPGKVELIMVQFPTPFRFTASILDGLNEKGFNSQLPQDAASGDFMVTENLLSEMYSTLTTNGKLLIQSNCEDVAVHMLNTARQVGFKPLAFNPTTNPKSELLPRNIPKRALDWQAYGGERASGVYWSSLPILPEYGRTETEVACMLDGKPVHRCLVVLNERFN